MVTTSSVKFSSFWNLISSKAFCVTSLSKIGAFALSQRLKGSESIAAWRCLSKFTSKAAVSFNVQLSSSPVSDSPVSDSPILDSPVFDSPALDSSVYDASIEEYLLLSAIKALYKVLNSSYYSWDACYLLTSLSLSLELSMAIMASSYYNFWSFYSSRYLYRTSYCIYLSNMMRSYFSRKPSNKWYSPSSAKVLLD